MASEFPRSPRLLKGALVTIAEEGATPSILPFQYNPETLTRKLDVRAPDTAARGDGQRLVGAPIETITVEVELDATDALEDNDKTTAKEGLHPQLAALELLVYPESASVVDNLGLIENGELEIAPIDGPLTLFVWGKRRIVPVQITELSVTEQAYDPNLNPIRARVSLSLRVLSYNDFPYGHFGNAIFLAHQAAKEALADAAPAGSVAALVGEDGSLT